MNYKYSTLEWLTFKQQVLLLYNADIIMTPHGTGIINIIFSIPHSTLIECFALYHYDRWYINTASQSIIHYILVSPFLTPTKINYFYKRVEKAYNIGRFSKYDRECRNGVINPPVVSIFNAVEDAIEYTSRWRFIYQPTTKWSPIFYYFV